MSSDADTHNDKSDPEEERDFSDDEEDDGDRDEEEQARPIVKKRHAPEQNNEDDEQDLDDEQDEDEDEDEDDEEDGDRPQKKRPRQQYNPFVEMEAEVDDDDDEFDEDEDELGKEDGFIEEDHEDVRQVHDARRHHELDRRRVEETALNDEDIAEQLKQRYSKRDYGRPARFNGDDGTLPQHTLIPSVEDPSLWVIRCKPGKEREIIMNLMNKYFDRENSDSPLEITSCFTRDSLKGYIYVEARKNASVISAVNLMNNLYMSRVSLVPIKDMVDTLQVIKKELNLQPGGWVRMRRGKYAGDLAQMIEVFDSGDLVRVKMIPRLDLTPKENREEDKKRKKTPNPLAFRPPQKLFNPKDVEKVDRSKAIIPKGRNIFTYGNDFFKEGYLEKDVKVSGLILENVNATLEEIQKFAGSGGDDALDGGVDLSTLAASAVKDAPAEFVPGDRVEVTSGEMTHMQGFVNSVDGTQVTITPKSEGVVGTLVFSASQLRKCFLQGAHVKVVHGRYKDETGLVIKVTENVITMVSDLNFKEVKVFAKDLREASEVSTGQNVLGNYELHDLVQLDFHTAAVIVKSERDSYKVLDQNGNVKTVQPHQISSKRDSKRAVATDSQGNGIHVGDTVRETEGERRTGTVLHLHKNFAFLHSREAIGSSAATSGVFVVRTRSIVSIAAKGGRAVGSGNIKPPVNNTFGIEPRGGGWGARDNSGAWGGGGQRGGATGGFGGRGGAPGPQMGAGRGGGRDPLINKTVTIIKGPHKGYLGIVKDASDMLARVELHSNCRTISIEKSKLGFKDASGKTVPIVSMGAPGTATGNHTASATTPRWGGDGGRTPAWGAPANPAWGATASGAQTPGWGTSAATPAWNQSGSSRTPAWGTSGSQTPAWAAASGTRTPAWGTSGSQTPAWGASGSKTPSHATGSRTPMHGSKTPAWDTGSQTPGWRATDDTA